MVFLGFSYGFPRVHAEVPHLSYGVALQQLRQGLRKLPQGVTLGIRQDALQVRQICHGTVEGTPRRASKTRPGPWARGPMGPWIKQRERKNQICITCWYTLPVLSPSPSLKVRGTKSWTIVQLDHGNPKDGNVFAKWCGQCFTSYFSRCPTFSVWSMTCTYRTHT